MPVSFKRIGANMRKVREAAGLRQEDVAAMLNISLTHYSNLERGMRHVKIDLIAQFCTALNIPVESILRNALGNVSICSSTSQNEPNDDEILVSKFSQIIRDCEPTTKQYMIDLCEKFAEVEKFAKR